MIPEEYVTFNTEPAGGAVYRARIRVQVVNGWIYTDDCFYVYQSGELQFPALPPHAKEHLLFRATKAYIKRFPNDPFEQDTPELLAYDLVDQED